MTLALTNGQMTIRAADRHKDPQMITALEWLITARATASKTEAEASKILSGIAPSRLPLYYLMWGKRSKL
ncbi:MAG: hypothetical protein IPP36_11290 [Nitrosomonadales bacterium]|nr:hypothetical protein [Nitrosomonadales bacterium]